MDNYVPSALSKVKSGLDPFTMPDLWEDLFEDDNGDIKDQNDTDDNDVSLNHGESQGINNYSKSHTQKGDGLSSFEEYRGFMVVDPDYTQINHRHFRTNEMPDMTSMAPNFTPTNKKGGPFVKDAFVSQLNNQRLFEKYGKQAELYGISWHLVKPEDKGLYPLEYVEYSGVLNRTTAYSINGGSHKQYSVLLLSVVDPNNFSVGSAGANWFNDEEPVSIRLGSIQTKCDFFNLDSNQCDQVRNMDIAHELGHRLSLRHIIHTYTLDKDDVGLMGDPIPTGKKILLSYDDTASPGIAQIKIKMQLQKRKDLGHIGNGYSTEIIRDEKLTFMPSLTINDQAGQLYEYDGDPDASGHQYGRWQLIDLIYDIDPTDFTYISNVSTVVEQAEVSLLFNKWDLLSNNRPAQTGNPDNTILFIKEIENGNLTATLNISRGYSCIIDAKFVEQNPEHQFTLICESSEPGHDITHNLHERIQLTGGKRNAEVGEE